MSEKEDFLSRWSRRKQEALRDAKPLREEDAETGQAKAGQQDSRLVSSRSAGARQDQDAETLFDLSRLPSLDSIGPGTDIRLFMQPGVPASLSRAALRRAWSSDPAIRDFVGLSENAWDFTKPESIPGFGGLLPIDDVKRLLSNVLPDKIQPILESELEQRVAMQQDNQGGEATSTSSQALDHAAELNSRHRVVEDDLQISPRCTKDDPAAQQEGSPDTNPQGGLKRRHGGALPT